MYNLLIVDDEISVVNGLAYDVDWDDIGIDNIFKANSSIQALDYMKKNRIDIVLSDIRMPEMDGLELAEKIRQQWPIVKIILISGYDEFKYAQKAIHCKVFRYITKPADYTEVKEIVIQAISEIDHELQQIKALENAKKQVNEIIPILQERYLNGWLVEGRLNPCLDSSAWIGCNLPLKIDASAFLMLIRVDEYRMSPLMRDDGIYEIAIQTLIKELLFKGEQVIFFKDRDGNQLVIIQSSSNDELHDKILYINEMAGSFQEAVRLSLKCIVSVIWGNVGTIEQLHELYVDLCDTVRRKAAFMTGILMAAEKNNSLLKVKSLNALNKNPSFNVLIETLQAQKALQRIDDIFIELINEVSPTSYNLFEIYNRISGIIIKESFNKGIELEEWAGGDAKYFYNFELIKSIGELKKWIERITNNFIEFIIKRDIKQTNHFIEKTKTFILQNVFREITLTEIANYIHIHPNYLSRLFREGMGLSIMDYIISLRISNARELLVKHDLKVYEVAEIVGFNSIAHFNRIFKREVGMTPKEYQANTIIKEK